MLVVDHDLPTCELLELALADEGWDVRIRTRGTKHSISCRGGQLTKCAEPRKIQQIDRVRLGNRRYIPPPPPHRSCKTVDDYQRLSGSPYLACDAWATDRDLGVLKMDGVSIHCSHCHRRTQGTRRDGSALTCSDSADRSRGLAEWARADLRRLPKCVTPAVMSQVSSTDSPFVKLVVM